MGLSRFVTFTLNQLVWAAPVEHVLEVLVHQSVARVPGASKQVAGLLNVHGRVICVLDLKAWLGHPSSARESCSVVVAETSANRMGLAVDDVLDVELLPTLHVPTHPADGGLPLLGTIDHDGRLVHVIDIESVLSTNTNPAADRHVGLRHLGGNP